MKTRAVSVGLAVVVLVFAGGCDSAKDKAAAAGSSSAASETKGGGDMAATCDKLCNKSVECAEDLAKQAGAADDVVKNAKAEASKGLAECKSGCSKDVAGANDKDKADMLKVDACLAKGCGEFIACMDAIK